jgi:hypothetical protein
VALSQCRIAGLLEYDVARFVAGQSAFVGR